MVIVRLSFASSGGVKTNFFSAVGMTDVQVDAQIEMLRNCSPIHQIGEPNDIADLVIYVTSNDAKYMTGSSLVIDGGTLYSSINIAK